MSDSETSGNSPTREERKRDEILKRLLKTPPSPRPKRERDEKKSSGKGGKSLKSKRGAEAPRR